MKKLLVTLGVLLIAQLLEGAQSPILLINGITGSKLRVNDQRKGFCNTGGNYVDLWANVLRVPTGCAQQELSSVYNNATDNFGDLDGVEVKVYDFGGTAGVEHLDPLNLIGYMNTMVNYFVARGYKRGESIRAAPYDWRYAADELELRGYYRNLTGLVEQMYNDNENQRVTIVIHSMGGLVSHYFLTRYGGINQSWKDKHIHAWVTLSGAWSGGVPALAAVLSGKLLDGSFLLGPINRLIAPIFGPLSRTLESISWLFPRTSVFGKIVVASTPTRNYTTEDYEALFKQIGYGIGYPVFKRLTEEVTPKYAVPNVDTHCFYGTGVNTAVRYTYNKELPSGTNFIQPSSIDYDDGDGAVNLISSQVCRKWANMQGHGFKEERFNNVNHLQIVSDRNVLSRIEEIVAI